MKNLSYIIRKMCYMLVALTMFFTATIKDLNYEGSGIDELNLLCLFLALAFGIFYTNEEIKGQKK